MNQSDRLHYETDNSCAMCGGREIQALTIHHIDGVRSHNTYENMILLCHNCHQRYHGNKGISREGIESQKRRLILKTITQYGLSAMKIAERNGVGVLAFPFLIYHLVELGYMKHEEEWDGAHISSTDTSGAAEGDIEVSARFAITDQGKQVLRKYDSSIPLEGAGHPTNQCSQKEKQS